MNFAERMNSGNRLLDRCLANTDNPYIGDAAEAAEQVIQMRKLDIKSPEIEASVHYLAGLEESGISNAIQRAIEGELHLVSPESPQVVVDLMRGRIESGDPIIRNILQRPIASYVPSWGRDRERPSFLDDPDFEEGDTGINYVV